MDVDELLENFALFDDDWEARYQYLIDLGAALPALPEADRTDENKVRGCMSQVWFVRKPTSDGTLDWAGDSDSSIVRGLIAVLAVLYRGRLRADARAVDVDAVFAKLGLERHLSPSRRNGFYAMVTRLKTWAQD